MASYPPCGTSGERMAESTTAAYLNGDHSSSTVDFFRVESLLSDEERAIRSRVRVFAEEQLRPIAQEAWVRGEFPAELVPKLAALGIVGGITMDDIYPSIGSVAFGLALQGL